MLRTFFRKPSPTLLLIYFIALCNSVGAEKKSILSLQNDVTLKMVLAHFKDCKKLPLKIDSSVTNHLSKYDSLGGKEVRILARHWLKDSINMYENHDAIMQDFYTIDSLKAHHAYKKYCDSLQPGMTKYGNAYALEKVTLTNDALLLVWAYVTSSYEADPNSGRTCVYFTLINDDTVGDTFVLAEEITFADPPSGSLFTCYSTLSDAGRLVMKETDESDDYDSMLAQIGYSHAIYNISPGSITRVSSAFDSTANRSIKNQ